MRHYDVLIFPTRIHFKFLLRNIFYQMLSEILSPIIRFPYFAGALSVSLAYLLGIHPFSDCRPEHFHATVILLVRHP